METKTEQTIEKGRVSAVGSGRLVRCFCVPALESCIRHRDDVIAYACDEEGKTLSQHYCSNEGFARSDIVGMSHEADYAKRYPEGYRTEWIGTAPADWEYSAPNGPGQGRAQNGESSP